MKRTTVAILVIGAIATLLPLVQQAPSMKLAQLLLCCGLFLVQLALPLLTLRYKVRLYALSCAALPQGKTPPALSAFWSQLQVQLLCYSIFVFTQVVPHCLYPNSGDDTDFFLPLMLFLGCTLSFWVPTEHPFTAFLFTPPKVFGPVAFPFTVLACIVSIAAVCLTIDAPFIGFVNLLPPYLYPVMGVMAVEVTARILWNLCRTTRQDG